MKVIIVRFQYDRQIEASCICNDDEVETVYKRTIAQLKDTDYVVSVINPVAAIEFDREIETLLE